MRAISLSKQGTKSETNEDACLVMANKGLFVVADGVGGGPSGDFASRTLVDQIYQSCGSKNSLTQDDILESIKKANREIVSAAQQSERIGMATTLACAFVSGAELITMHVGDSRIYRLRDGRLERLTQDHVKDVERSDGSIKSVVTNAIGVRPEIKIDIKSYPFEAGDVIVLFSDGVTDVLGDAVISDVLSSQSRSTIEKLNELMRLSDESGGRDDKTIVYVFSPS